jgi:cytochrome c553
MYRDGRRKNAMMSAMAKNLTDADIANLAAYYSSLK